MQTSHQVDQGPYVFEKRPVDHKPLNQAKPESHNLSQEMAKLGVVALTGYVLVELAQRLTHFLIGDKSDR
jgi:hypothetical protein